MSSKDSNWKYRHIRRRTHNRGLHRIGTTFFSASVTAMALGLWALYFPSARIRAVLLLLLAGGYFLLGTGMYDKRSWAWPTAMLLLLLQCAILPALAWPYWWLGLLAALAMLPMGAYLMQETVRRRFLSTNEQRRIPISHS